MREKKISEAQDPRAYGEWVRRLRESLGLTREQFAARIGVSRKTVQQVEYGVQNLGRAPKIRVQELAEGPVDYRGEGPMLLTEERLRMIVQSMLREETQQAVRKLAEATGICHERAWIAVLRERLSKA